MTAPADQPSDAPQTPPQDAGSPPEAESPDALYHPEKVGYSLANLRELLFGCLEAAGARSVVEIGADQGYLTEELARWAAPRGGRVTAIDTLPSERLRALVAREPAVELAEATSHRALAELEPADAYIVDGDHNHFTVSGELERLEGIGERRGGFPLVLFHDVAWPHARRDTYYDPENVPARERQPLARDAAIVPWDPGAGERGLRYPAAAQREGGERNGVLTAIEDFLATRPRLRFARVPAFFGFGAMWDSGSEAAPRIAAVVEPLADHPVLERLEANRVALLAARLGEQGRAAALAEENDRLRRRQVELEQTLEPMLAARAMRIAEWISKLKAHGRRPPTVSIERARRALRGR